MGATFSELPPALQRDIERSVVKVAHAVTEQEASNIIYSYVYHYLCLSYPISPFNDFAAVVFTVEIIILFCDFVVCSIHIYSI